MKHLINKNSFFFFVDFLKDFETKYFKIDTFFSDSEFLFPNKYFSFFSIEKIDFDFLEKNEKLLTFFYIFNKLFFKDQIKNLKTCLLNEFSSIKIKKGLKINFFLNFYFFFRYYYTFIFLIKKIAIIKFNKI